MRKWVRGVLFVGSVGLALHLVLPQLPGLENSLRLLASTSHPLVGAEEIRGACRQLAARPAEVPKLAALGYWAFDVVCLIVMFYALGVVADPIVVLVAYGVSTTIAALPLTPGGIGIFEVSMLATLAVLGVGSEAAIPILGYRLFNFWLPIPLAAVFYPTLRYHGRDSSPGG